MTMGCAPDSTGPGPTVDAVVDSTGDGPHSIDATMIDAPQLIQDADPNTCDIIAQTGCALGDACYPLSQQLTVGYCHAPGAAGQGASCSQDFDCTTEHHCVSNKCTKTCDMNSDCPAVKPMCALYPPHNRFGFCY